MRSRVLPVLALTLSLTTAVLAAEQYPLPEEYPGFPFPVRQSLPDPPGRYELDLNPGLDEESRRILDELERMTETPSRLALKLPLVWILESTGLATPGGWGWLLTQKPEYIAGEAGAAVAMRFLNNEPVPRVAGTVAFESHLHTQCSQDSAGDLESILIHAARKGLQAVAVTDHNMIACAFRAVGLAAELRNAGRLPPEFIVVVGEEIGTSQGHVVGLFLRRYVSPGMTAAETIREIHAQGGLAVAAHQGEASGYLAPSLVRNLPFDAVEIGSGALFLPFDFYYVLRAGGTSSHARLFGMDSHYSRMPGWLGYNRVTVREPGEPGLKNAIRGGATEPVFSSFYAGYRRFVERPAVSGAYRAGAFYFTLRGWLGGHLARMIGADGVEISSGYEESLRDLLNLITAVGVVQDYLDDEGVFSSGPRLSVSATFGALAVGYQTKGGDLPARVFLEYRRGF